MTIATIDQLEAVVGKSALGVRMKIIDHIDATAAKWIDASTIAFIGVGEATGPRVTLSGGKPGFAAAIDQHTLRIPLDAIDDPALLQPGLGVGVLCLAPGVGETLRANGRVKAVTNAHADLAIEECFVHCAKALIRSDFWTARPALAPTDPTAFVNATGFLALATMDKRGLIDISPKGDPAGLLLRLDGDRAVLAERPGNKLAFGYRNIIEDKRVAACAIIPGDASAATFEGAAILTADEAIRAPFTVDNRTPILATLIEGVRPKLGASPALQRAAPWSGQQAEAQIDPAAVLVAHIKLNKEQGLEATAMRLAVNRGLVAAGLKDSYAKRLY
jgi:predicted pyridoxine 5'-phosphate oxidase superfamily flavin-nucleotide-binding protein